MKEFAQLAAFVAPSVRQASTRSNNYAPISSAFREISRGASAPLCAEASLSAPLEPAGVYEAVAPPTETLLGMGFIVVLCVVLYWVWENQVVPVSRTKLAISKSRGEVKEYLDELKASSPSVESSTDASSLLDSGEVVSEIGELALQSNSTATTDEVSTASPSTTDDRAFERWLFTDWLQDNKSARKGGRQKEPALPILKDAKWNSGDNPVVVAAFLMLVGLFFTAFTERLATIG